MILGKRPLLSTRKLKTFNLHLQSVTVAGTVRHQRMTDRVYPVQTGKFDLSEEGVLYQLCRCSTDETTSERGEYGQDKVAQSTVMTFQIQQTALEALQCRLEHAAFAFCRENAPEILQRKRWACAEDVEWTEWLKYMLTPANECLLPDFTGDNKNRKARDIFKEAFDIRHSAVHRKHRSIHDILHLLRVARDILVAFNDPHGAFLAHRYITISLEVATTAERNDEEIYLLESIAEAKSREVLRMEFSSIRTRLANRFQYQLQHIAYLATTIELETPQEIATSSSSHGKLDLIGTQIAQAIIYVVCQIHHLLLQQALISWAIVHMIIIGGMLYTLHYIDG